MSAWGKSFGSAWGSAWGQVAKPPVKHDTGWLGGGAGLYDHRQSNEEKRAERERLGILPPEIKRAVEVVARIEARNPVAATADDSRAAVEALARELERDEIAWRDFYADLLREELRRLIGDELAQRMLALIEEQDEEQAILLLMAEM